MLSCHACHCLRTRTTTPKKKRNELVKTRTKAIVTLAKIMLTPERAILRTTTMITTTTNKMAMMMRNTMASYVMVDIIVVIMMMAT